ncbi:MAG: AarF/UbiB family protein [Firmicutes bacterium]|nr:AarF/UbiB family protein [Bacillota bacterium]
MLLLSLAFVRYYWQLRFIARFRKRRKQELEARVFAKAGAQVRRSALRLQGLIVKVGQFLSARADVLPLAFTRELTQLQDAVPAAPYDGIRQRIEQELGASVAALFQSFEEEATAAASLGQVHRATMSDGRVVAVKVLRPGIERLADADLAALRTITRFLQRFTKFGRRLHVSDIYDEFAKGVREELDYRLEAAYLERFRKNFENNPRIVVPGIVDRLITKSVFVMDFIDGVKVSDLEQLRRWQINPRAIVELLVDAYLRQMLEYGLVHIDPHPGNLLVLRDGRLCVLDFGMMAEVPAQDVRVFAALVQAAITRNLDGVVEAIDRLGFLQPYANRAILTQAIGMIIDRLNGFQLARGPELDRFIEDFQDFLHDEPLILKANYLFVGRAIGMLTGVLTTLDPGIDWWNLLKERALPLLNANAGERDQNRDADFRSRLRQAARELFGDSAAVVVDILLTQAQDTGLALVRLPGVMQRVLEQADRGDLTVSVDLEPMLTRLDRLERLFARLRWTLLFGVALALGIWLHAMRVFVPADLAYALSSISFVLMIAPGRQGRRRPRTRRRPARQRR